MFPEETKAIIECILFVASEPVPLKTLCEISGIEKEDALQVIDELKQEFESRNRGIRIQEIAKGYQMCTKPQFAEYIERLYKPQSSYGLSKAALETLAIIAYKQPITRGEVEVIRGVKVDSSIGNLVEKNLIREVGRKEGPGRPILFGTSDNFLKYFGLKDISELPDPKDFIIQNIDPNELNELLKKSGIADSNQEALADTEKIEAEEN
jgi:segregation and condensation protein B